MLLGFYLLGALVSLPACVPYTPSTLNYPADWNRKGIDWRPYGLGMRDAKKANKPIVLVFYTDWCPHRHNYSRVFHDPRLIAASKDFIMIRVERDGNRELSEQYDLDGDYIPRTLFLSSDGTVLEEFDAGRSEYRYFLDEFEADETLELMSRAKALPEADSRASEVEPR
jgi:thiol-disulfide isomerase/thioredoxin